jgi:hypothetical protein
LVVSHTSPSGGAILNSKEIVNYYNMKCFTSDRIKPVIFAGDWYVQALDKIQSFSRRDKKVISKKVTWDEYLQKIKLTKVLPTGDGHNWTNMPHDGNGQVADYFIWNDYFSGTARILKRESGAVYLKQDIRDINGKPIGRQDEDALYGWGDVTDHAPVLAEITINIRLNLVAQSSADERLADSGNVVEKKTGRVRTRVKKFGFDEFHKGRKEKLHQDQKQSRNKQVEAKRK